MVSGLPRLRASVEPSVCKDVFKGGIAFKESMTIRDVSGPDYKESPHSGSP